MDNFSYMTHRCHIFCDKIELSNILEVILQDEN
jgi:hypothetical protein